MSNVIYMGIEKWQSLLNSIRQKAGIQTLLTADTAKTAVDNIPTGSSATITDASYLFYKGARANEFDDIVSLIAPETYNFEGFTNSFSGRVYDIDLSDFTGNSNNPFNFKDAFRGNSSIGTIILPALRTGRTFNLSYAFAQTPSLKELDMSNITATNLESTFADATGLTTEKLNISNMDTSNVTSLYATFSGCKELTELDLSDWTIGTNTVMYRTFYRCTAMTKLTLGVNTMSYGYQAGNYSGSPINGCTALTTLRVKATTPPTVPGAYVFQSSKGVCPLSHIYVPAASVADYQAASGWSTYASLISEDPEE